MPIYEYQCKKCKAHIEVFQKLSDKAPSKCGKCGGKLEKQVSAAAIQFKGSGFYVNDYARAGKNGKKSTSSSESAEKASSGDKGSDKSASEKSDSDKSGGKETSPVKKTSDSASSTKASSSD